MEYNIQSFLERLGLSKNEIKLYHAALDLGESSVTDCAKKSGIHRVAAYGLVDSLKKKGLITVTTVSHGKLISAKHPRELRTLIQRKQREIRKMELKYEELLPELSSLYFHNTARPRVRFYEGVQGLEQVNHDIIETLKELPEDERITYSYSNPNSVDDVFEEYVTGDDGYVNMRKKYGIFNKVIALDGPITQDISQRDEEELRDMIILPEERFPFVNDITIYANKIAIMALQHELVGVVVESAEIVQDQLAIFDLAWRGAQSIQE